MSKRTKIVLISVVVLLVGLAYGISSIYAWKGYETRLKVEKAEYSQLRATALNGNSTDERLKAIRALDDKVSRRGDLCGMNFLFAWQAAVVPPINDGVNQCKIAAKQLDTLAAPLSELRDYLDVGVKVQSSVKKLVPSTSLSEDNWKKLGLERAQEVQKELAAVTANSVSAKQLKEQAESLSKQLTSSWEKLIKANSDKDATAFVNASAGVTSAYAGFAELADKSDSTLQSLVEKLQAAA